jgi:hypothetical protein
MHSSKDYMVGTEINVGPPQQLQPMGYANQGAQQSSSFAELSSI